MLVLTRKQDETIVIDGRIKVKVIRIRGKTVRIGITAPAEIAIRRSELSVLAGPVAKEPNSRQRR